MRNPLQDEETAFRFVLGTIAYLVPIVLASWIASWLGFVVFLVATGTVIALLRRGTRRLPVPEPGGRAAVEDTRRILVIADETIAGPRLREEIVRVAHGVSEDVLVICPLIRSPSGSPSPAERSREGEHEAAMRERLETALVALRAGGINARGEIVDRDPLAALADVLERFAPDEIVISIRADGGVPGAAATLADAARSRFSGPVTLV